MSTTSFECWSITRSLVRFTQISFQEHLPDWLVIFCFSLMIKCQVFHSNHSKSFHIYATEKLIFSSRIPLPLSREHCRKICLNMIYICIWLLVEKCSSGYHSHPEFYLAFEEGNCHAPFWNTDTSQWWLWSRRLPENQARKVRLRLKVK